jgi:hypothetical protein
VASLSVSLDLSIDSCEGSNRGYAILVHRAAIYIAAAHLASRM